MSDVKVQSEVLEDSKKGKLTVEIPAEEFTKSINKVFNRQKNRINIPGFRKGKVPRKIVEKMYGKEFFYDDAANDLISAKYSEAYEQSELEIVSQPEIDIVQAEEGKDFIFTAVVALRPEVGLCEYKGVEVTKIDTTVTDEEIDEEIKKDLETNSRNVEVEGPAEDGDTVVIDYEGFADGVAFDGGKAEGHELKLGSKSFIPGFEDQLVGKAAGEDVEVNVTFPEEYHAPDLAGKDAVFKVKVHEVRRQEVPELDEEYVEDIGFDSIDEYKEDIKNRISERKEKDAKAKREDEAIKFIADQSDIEVPEEMVDTQVNSSLNDYANNMMQSGISFSQYLQMTGMTVEKLRDQLRPETVDRIRASLVLEEIVKKENIEVSDEDVDSKLEEMAKMYHMSLEDIKKDMPESELDSLKGQIRMEKAIDLILENVVEVERDEEE